MKILIFWSSFVVVGYFLTEVEGTFLFFFLNIRSSAIRGQQIF